MNKKSKPKTREWQKRKEILSANQYEKTAQSNKNFQHDHAYVSANDVEETMGKEIEESTTQHIVLQDDPTVDI
ncbi:hypothetical protein ILUMI_19840 [Ignelater luminosus]|uniref:Uncharacterized protein n=1 Tax=Ignelater luminosus TaxID=2038154 RepID=A0A8K0G2U2_IGNLU|nr:hypothetical protein ILUMI_19840 [Ignelater luminosus]